MKDNKKRSIIIISLFVVILIVICIGLIFLNRKKEVPNASNKAEVLEQSIEKTSAEKATSSEDELSNILLRTI